MSHDKIKDATRRRMAATGEPYAAARREVTAESRAADQVTSAVSADDIRAAAYAHRELGPDYGDAVVASFIDKVDREVAARVEARLANPARSTPAARERRPLTRRVVRDVLAASAGALLAVGAVGIHEVTSAHPRPPAGKLAGAPCGTTAGQPSPCSLGQSRTNRVRILRITFSDEFKAAEVIPGSMAGDLPGRR
jgi:hypothetical protein